MRQAAQRILIVGMFLFHASLVGQIVQPADSLADSTIVLPTATTPGDTLHSTSRGTKSPATAMLLSALLPGAGQFYNGSYWKVPIVLGFGIYFISSWLDNNRRLEDYREKYNQSLISTANGDQRLLAVREFYKEQRDSFTWYFFILYLLSIADAYVDASLYDFQVGGDLSIQVVPVAPFPGQAMSHAQLSVRINF